MASSYTGLGTELMTTGENAGTWGTTTNTNLQILEQILPFFQPHYNLAVKLLPSMNETKDVPVVLNSVEYEDDYENNFQTRRAIIYTLQFTVKTYLYGPVSDKSSELITKAIVDYATDSKVTASREVRYQVTPQPADADPDDDFGFNELFSEFTDGLSRNPTTGNDE